MPARNIDDVLLEEELTLTLGELCRACDVSAEYALTLVEEGLLEPLDEEMPPRFTGASLRRVRVVVRLQRDLQVNLPGAALALEMLDELRFLRERVRRLEQLLGE